MHRPRKEIIVLHEGVVSAVVRDALQFGVAIFSLVLNKLFLDYESFAFVIAILLVISLFSVAYRRLQGGSVFTREDAIKRINEIYGEE